jgi:DNA-binding phage protein
MKNNKFGKKNAKHSCPDISKLKFLVDSNLSKKDICNSFNIKDNYQTLNRWLKENQLKIMPYRGTSVFNNEQELEDNIVKIKNLIENGKTLAEIAKELNLTRQVTKTLIEKAKLSAPTKFDIWKKQYEDVLKNLEFYVIKNRTQTLLEISNEYNISIEQLKRAFKEKGLNPKIHSYNKSKGEIECRDFIRSLGVFCDSYRFEKKYEIDCYVSDKNFGLEYCGEYWHQYLPYKKNKKYHIEKTLYFENCGIKLMTIFESEWKSEKRHILESMIKSRLGLIDNKIFARKCIVREIDKETANNFHISNHISGKTTSSKNYGLYYKETLVSVLSIIKSRFDKKYQYEISRFSSMKNTIVIGGLSKLYDYFVKQMNPISCMTYADLRFGQGLSYTKIGFTCEGITPPNYHYYNKNTELLESRMKYQKSKLTKMLEYDSSKTEFQIMTDAGYFIVFDCGNKKYGWKNPTHINDFNID